MQIQNPGDVFISYRHSNTELVKPIVEEFQRRGISYFIDMKDIDYGDEYSNVIYRAILDCKIMLIVLTEDVKGSKDIPREIRIACNKDKEIFPYKIGFFNIDILDYLEYDICLVNSYEVPCQTSETITEIANRIESKLNELISKPAIKCELPPRIQDYNVLNYSIDDITVNVDAISENSGTKLTDKSSVNGEGLLLPPLSQTLERVFSENKGLQIAIEKFQAFTHPALDQANDALEKAKAQLIALKERKNQGFRSLTPAIRQQLENDVKANPECTIDNLNLSIDDMDHQELLNLDEQIDCVKKLKEAQMVFDDIKNLRQEKCDQIVANIKSKIQNNIDGVSQFIEEYIDSFLYLILKDHPGFDDLDASFPVKFILNRIQGLETLLCGMKSGRIIKRYAKRYWSEKRPCVIKNQKQLREELQTLDRICEDCHNEVKWYNRMWIWLWRPLLIVILIVLVFSGLGIFLYNFNLWAAALGLFVMLLVLFLFKCIRLSMRNRIGSKYLRIAEQGKNLCKYKISQCFIEIADECFRVDDYKNAKYWLYLALDCRCTDALYNEQIKNSAPQSYLKYADQYFENKNKYPEAIALFTDLAVKGGERFRSMLNDCYLKYAQWSHTIKNYSLTINICEKMVERDIHRKIALDMLAESYCSLGDVSYHAEEMYKKSADLGYIPAMIKLGDLYFNNAVRGYNDSNAIDWYSKAADLGDVRALFKLALCYEIGAGVEKNRLKAYKLYIKAAEMGYYEAKNKVDELEEIFDALNDDEEYEDDDNDEENDD